MFCGQLDGGYPRSNSKLTLRYGCCHANSERQYKIFQESGNSFILYRTNVDFHHEEGVKIACHVRGSHREEVEAQMHSMTATEYLTACEATADVNLTVLGNLQECISMATAEKIRSEELQEQDFDMINFFTRFGYQSSGGQNY